MTKRTGRCNDIGAMFTSNDPAERIQSIKIYPQGEAVHFIVETLLMHAGQPCGTSEALQYLTPNEAMALAKGLERSAIEALKHEGE